MNRKNVKKINPLLKILSAAALKNMQLNMYTCASNYQFVYK